ncbi:EamA family transporter [Streptomyces sp. Cmuel-A718b]|uniref:DMT family transporter n=1 Tax=unclassified Streptomyces TaxID=2593676 RepID=UPI00081DB12F|nr:EamA family transporter [Streptomyces sp. Cmuel-A718b]SCF67996.1 probable blue pigment (indigoidine) exporter [Streptomyces sp. Cmuel-A718b]
MEGNLRWALTTAVAPVAWGATYFVTREFLPAGNPLYGAVIRALPAGLLLLAVCRKLPRGIWWVKSLVLGALNMSGFFALVYVAAQRLPTSMASIIMAVVPLAMMLLAWGLVGERPGPRHLAGAGVGIAGVCLMVFTATGSVDPLGILASLAAMGVSSFGYVLAKRWSGEVDVLASTGWQLTGGGLLLLPFAVLTEGAPPSLDGPALLGFAYVTVVATAFAFAVWFAGLAHLPAGTVGLLGLLNPVTGVLLGVLIADETLSGRQICGLLLTLCGVLLGRQTARPRRTPDRTGGRTAGPENRRATGRATERDVVECARGDGRSGHSGRSGDSRN